MAKHDLTFLFIAVLFMIAALVIFQPNETVGYGAKEPVSVPYIKLISPGKSSEIFIPHQTFIYEVKNVDYDVVCQLLINDEAQSYDLVKPGQRVRVSTKLSEGVYKWAAQCKLLNGRTISSAQNSLTISSHTKMGTTQITGRVVDQSSHDPKQSYVIAMVLIVSLVWIMNLRIKSQR